MRSIVISRKGRILAEHTTDHPQSHYGQPVWVVRVESPKLGAAQWQQGDTVQEVEIVDARDGWLICRQGDGALCGIIWSDGDYYGNLLVDNRDKPVTEYDRSLVKAGTYHVRGTAQFPGSPLGALLSGPSNALDALAELGNNIARKRGTN